MLKFSDGINIDTSGELRVLVLHDGCYVVGEGTLIPFNNEIDCKKYIMEHKDKKDIFCNGCKNLKFNTWKDVNYCDIYGLKISGTLERPEICKSSLTKEKENKDEYFISERIK